MSVTNLLAKSRAWFSRSPRAVPAALSTTAAAGGPPAAEEPGLPYDVKRRRAWHAEMVFSKAAALEAEGREPDEAFLAAVEGERSAGRLLGDVMGLRRRAQAAVDAGSAPAQAWREALTGEVAAGRIWRPV